MQVTSNKSTKNLSGTRQRSKGKRLVTSHLCTASGRENSFLLKERATLVLKVSGICFDQNDVTQEKLHKTGGKFTSALTRSQRAAISFQIRRVGERCHGLLSSGETHRDASGWPLRSRVQRGSGHFTSRLRAASRQRIFPRGTFYHFIAFTADRKHH